LNRGNGFVPFFNLIISTMLEEKIKNLVNERCLQDDLKDCFLVDVQLSKSNRLTVFIDSDEGVSYAKCRQISRYLEAEIEENGWLPQKYTLDVSSPGAEKPMKILRQFHKHVGRELKIKLKDGQEITGDLLKIDGQTLEISSTKADNIEIDFNDVQQASIIIKFK